MMKFLKKKRQKSFFVRIFRNGIQQINTFRLELSLQYQTISEKSMSTALIIVDPQNDFCQNGSLAVAHSNQIFPYINKLKASGLYDYVFITQDWHPQNHVSFAHVHEMNPFTTIQIGDIAQELWPSHCVMGTQGAEISPLLEVTEKDITVFKGVHTHEDSYSGFGTSNAPSNLRKKLEDREVKRVHVVGLAYDFCVGSTAIDAKKAGFEVQIIKEATKSVMESTKEIMDKKLEDLKIDLISFRDVPAAFEEEGKIMHLNRLASSIC